MSSASRAHDDMRDNGAADRDVLVLRQPRRLKRLEGAQSVLTELLSTADDNSARRLEALLSSIASRIATCSIPMRVDRTEFDAVKSGLFVLIDYTTSTRLDGCLSGDLMDERDRPDGRVRDVIEADFGLPPADALDVARGTYLTSPERIHMATRILSKFSDGRGEYEFFKLALRLNAQFSDRFDRCDELFFRDPADRADRADVSPILPPGQLDESTRRLRAFTAACRDPSPACDIKTAAAHVLKHLVRDGEQTSDWTRWIQVDRTRDLALVRGDCELTGVDIHRIGVLREIAFAYPLDPAKAFSRSVCLFSNIVDMSNPDPIFVNTRDRARASQGGRMSIRPSPHVMRIDVIILLKRIADHRARILTDAFSVATILIKPLCDLVHEYVGTPGSPRQPLQWREFESDPRKCCTLCERFHAIDADDEPAAWWAFLFSWYDSQDFAVMMDPLASPAVVHDVISRTLSASKRSYAGRSFAGRAFWDDNIVPLMLTRETSVVRISTPYTDESSVSDPSGAAGVHAVSTSD